MNCTYEGILKLKLTKDLLHSSKGKWVLYFTSSLSFNRLRKGFGGQVKKKIETKMKQKWNMMEEKGKRTNASTSRTQRLFGAVDRSIDWLCLTRWRQTGRGLGLQGHLAWPLAEGRLQRPRIPVKKEASVSLGVLSSRLQNNHLFIYLVIYLFIYHPFFHFFKEFIFS